jgi:dCTP deaminase
VSYGLSHYGYDVRLAWDYKVYSNHAFTVADPHDFNPALLIDCYALDSTIIVPAGGFILARTIEWIKVPRDVLASVADKSTLRRCGITLGYTKLEPEWQGHITVEIHNCAPFPVILSAGEGIGQVIFWVADQPCQRSYKDKAGKYQDQTGVTLPRV